MLVSSLRLDPDVARYLNGPVLDAVAHRVEATGDCVVCNRPLGEGPVSLTLDWSELPERFAYVLPAHAACQPSTLIKRGRFEISPVPAPTHRCVSFMTPQVGPVFLLNQSVDVLTGGIVEGRWIDEPAFLFEGEPAAAMKGLEKIDPADHPVPSPAARWGAHLNRRRHEITVTDPQGGTYTCNAEPDLEQAVQESGRLLVMVTEEVRTATVKTLVEIVTAMEGGHVYAAWAVVGASAADIALTDRSGIPTPAAASRITSTAQMTQAMEDTQVNVRAAFSDHPALQLTAPDAAVPVLLLEPEHTFARVSPDGDAQDLRVESAIGAGLTRTPPVPATAILDRARDWSVRTTTRLGRTEVQLVAPFDRVVAQGSLRYPPRWKEAADGHGAVLIIYGPMIGVRSPRGRSYNDADRYEELTTHRARGMVAWGLVTWSTT